MNSTKRRTSFDSGEENKDLSNLQIKPEVTQISEDLILPPAPIVLPVPVYKGKFQTPKNQNGDKSTRSTPFTGRSQNNKEKNKRKKTDNNSNRHWDSRNQGSYRNQKVYQHQGFQIPQEMVELEKRSSMENKTYPEPPAIGAIVSDTSVQRTPNINILMETKLGASRNSEKSLNTFCGVATQMPKERDDEIEKSRSESVPNFPPPVSPCDNSANIINNFQMECSPANFGFNSTPIMFPSLVNSGLQPGDQTTSAAHMSQISAMPIDQAPEDLLIAMQEVDPMWQHDCAVDCTLQVNTPVEVVVGGNLNEFHIGSITDITSDEEKDNKFEWIVVNFQEWGEMNVPSIRCRITTQPYPYPLSNKNLEVQIKVESPLPNTENQMDETPVTTPVRDDKKSDLDTLSPSPGQVSISPPQWTPVWTSERKLGIKAFRAGDSVDLFMPSNNGEPPKWIRSKIVRAITCDPRTVKYLDLPLVIPTNQPIQSADMNSQAWHCARFWGGYCQCSMGSPNHPCMALNGGIINADSYPFFYEMDWPKGESVERSIVPWQFVRSPNLNGGIEPSDIVETEVALPPFLTSVLMSAAALNTLIEESKLDDESKSETIIDDGIWIKSEHSTRLLNQIRHHSKVLFFKLTHGNDDCYQITYIGTTSQTMTATTFLNGEIAHIKSSIEFYERREKRLKLLEERKSRYERNEQLEFEADDSLVGLIIGKQGEHLSKVARTYKVEIRVLPDDQGFRRVRIYGANLANAQKAKNELIYCFKYLPVNQEVCNQLNDRRGALIKDISQRLGVNSIWIDVGNPEDKSGIRDATVVSAAQQAATHPVKCRDIIRGTLSNPVLVLCGIESIVEKITTSIQKFMSSNTPGATLVQLLGLHGPQWTYNNNNNSNYQDEWSYGSYSKPSGMSSNRVATQSKYNGNSNSRYIHHSKATSTSAPRK